MGSLNKANGPCKTQKNHKKGNEWVERQASAPFSSKGFTLTPGGRKGARLLAGPLSRLEAEQPNAFCARELSVGSNESAFSGNRFLYS